MPAQSPSWSPAVPAEVTDSFRAVLSSAWGYLEARLKIARLEGTEALRVGLGVAVLALVVVLSLIVVYVGSMLVLTLWAARTWGDGNVLLAALTLVVGHLVLAVVCALWAARAVRRRRLFHATRKEFMEDKRWLQANQTFKS